MLSCVTAFLPWKCFYSSFVPGSLVIAIPEPVEPCSEDIALGFVEKVDGIGSATFSTALRYLKFWLRLSWSFCLFLCADRRKSGLL